MKQVAVIGSGISGMASAAILAGRTVVTVYERNQYVGGHSNTVVVDGPGGPVPVDTGFMVYNEVTYPRLTRLFADLGVETMATDMSFGVHHVSRRMYWGSQMPQGLLAQKRNLTRPAFWRLLNDLARFNWRARAALGDPHWDERSLGDFVESLRLSKTFLDLYLLPMTAAIWSTPHRRMLDFPAATLLRFLFNHGLLGVTTQHPWRTVRGGSRQYREKLIAPYRRNILTARGARRIDRLPEGVRVVDAAGEARVFDAVVVATHADEALALLGSPSIEESRLLGAFEYSDNRTLLHSDARVMPPRAKAWMSWNYRVETRAEDGDLAASTHYWMNRLQDLHGPINYFVSLNPPDGLIEEKQVAWSGHYRHPVFTLPAVRAQRQLVTLNRRGPVYFAGSYFRYGFHEDALMAGEDAARAVLQQFDEQVERDASVVSL